MVTSANYQALFDYLRVRPGPELRVTFRDLDQILGGLPESARRYPAWWSNTITGQPHAWAWLKAGRMARADLQGAVVTFVSGYTDVPIPPAARQRRAVAISEEATEHGTVSVAFDWRDAGAISLSSEQLTFPALPSAPGLYRFILRSATANASIYIGESVNLARRMQNYRTPGPRQATNLRMNERLRSTLGSGGTAQLEVALSVRVDGQEADLRSQAVRRLAENAASFLCVRNGVKTENL